MKNSEFQLTKKVITALVTSCLLGSCASETYQTAVKQGRDDNATASRLEQESHGTANRADLSTIQVHDGIYLGAEAVKTHGGQVLPDRFEQEGVRLVAAQPLDLNGLGDLLTQATGIPVSFAADVFAPAQTAPTGGPGGMGMAGGMVGASRQATIPSRSTAADLAAALNAASANNAHPVADLGMATPMLFTDGATSSSRGKMHINYKGPLSGFLNQTGAYFDISWTYRDGRIQFQRNVTRTFTLVTMPTIVQSESDVNSGISGSGGSGGGSGGSGGGSGGGGGGSSGGGSSGGSGGSGGSSSSGGLTVGASQTASVTVALDFWKDLEKTLKTILGSSGNFSTSTSMSEVTVTAPPSQIARVADYIQGVNKQLLRQVTVQVQVYSVNVSASSDWQFQLNAFFKSHGILSGGLGGASSGSLAPGASENLPQSAILTFGGKLAGSQAVLQALDSLGTTDVVTSASVTTMSGQPVPLQVGKTTGYVSQIGSTSLSDTSSSTTATASTISSGFSLNVLPKVMDDGKVLLQYSINLSSLAGQDRGFDSVDIGGGQKMEVPDINQRSFIQEGMIDNGATLVLAGFEAMQDNSTDNGMGTPNFKLLGGTRSGAHDRQVLVICITPVVLDHSGSLPGYN